VCVCAQHNTIAAGRVPLLAACAAANNASATCLHRHRQKESATDLYRGAWATYRRTHRASGHDPEVNDDKSKISAALRRPDNAGR